MYILCLLILFHLNLYVTFLVLHDYVYYLYYSLFYLFLHRSGWVYAASIAVNRYLTSTILHEYPLPLSWVTVWYLCLVNRYLPLLHYMNLCFLSFSWLTVISFVINLHFASGAFEYIMSPIVIYLYVIFIVQSFCFTSYHL